MCSHHRGGGDSCTEPASLRIAGSQPEKCSCAGARILVVGTVGAGRMSRVAWM